MLAVATTLIINVNCFLQFVLDEKRFDILHHNATEVLWNFGVTFNMDESVWLQPLNPIGAQTRLFVFI